jgi:putative restriction endonuclease
MLSLSTFLSKLKTLKQGVTMYGNAPHKLILLLTIIDLIAKEYFKENKFTITPDFVGEFLENWSLLVETKHQADFTQPLYYLQSEKIDNQPIWQLVPKQGFQIKGHIKSVNTLKEVLAYAALNEDVFLLLLDKENRNSIRSFILDTYFTTSKFRYLQAKQQGEGYIQNVSKFILNEKEIPEYMASPVNPISEQERFVRSGLFPRLISMVYNYTCCISGMRLITTKGHTLIEACHIIPFKISGNDRVTNGLSLCPNLHTAFDKGLIGIDKQYKVVVSTNIEEDCTNPYNLTDLQGKTIALPFGKKHYPAQENLQWHLEHVFDK